MEKSLSILNSFNVKRILFLTIFVFTSLFLHAQERGILLKNKSNQSTILLKENTRIKVQNMYGAKYIGNFTVIDDKTIMLQGQKMALESIFSIMSFTIGSQAAKPLLIVGGVLVIGVGMIAAFGIALTNGTKSSTAEATLLTGTLTGATMITIPLISNNHYRQKWECTIITGK